MRLLFFINTMTTYNDRVKKIDKMNIKIIFTPAAQSLLTLLRSWETSESRGSRVK